jgi:flagellin-like protein
MKTVRKLKAVSPVIATLLLIAIAVAAGIILYVFVSGITGTLTGVPTPTAASAQATLVCVAQDGTSFGFILHNGGRKDLLIEAANLVLFEADGDTQTPSALDDEMPPDCDGNASGTDPIRVPAGQSVGFEAKISDPGSRVRVTVKFINVVDVEGNVVTIGDLVFQVPPHAVGGGGGGGGG